MKLINLKLALLKKSNLNKVWSATGCTHPRFYALFNHSSLDRIDNATWHEMARKCSAIPESRWA